MEHVSAVLLLHSAVLRISTLPIEYTANLKLWRIILALAELAPRYTGYTGGNDRETMKRAIARTKTRIFVIIVSIKLNSNYLTFQLYRYFAISLSYESEFRKGIEKFQSRRSWKKKEEYLHACPYSDPFTIEIFVAIRRCQQKYIVYRVCSLVLLVTTYSCAVYRVCC